MGYLLYLWIPSREALNSSILKNLLLHRKPRDYPSAFFIYDQSNKSSNLLFASQRGLKSF